MAEINLEPEMISVLVPVPDMWFEPRTVPKEAIEPVDVKSMTKRELRKTVRRMSYELDKRAWEMQWMADHGGVMPSEADAQNAFWEPVWAKIGQSLGYAIDKVLGAQDGG